MNSLSAFLKKISIICVLVLLGGMHAPTPLRQASAVQAIQAHYYTNIDAFAQSLEVYRQQLENEAVPPDQLTIAHCNSRLAYKRVEYLLAHFDASAVTSFLNGAPLPVIRQINRQEIEVLEPEGLQVLDEMVVHMPIPRQEMRAKLQVITSQYAPLAAFEKQRQFDERKVIEAMKQQLIRIMALGITGFDTPGTLNGLAEAQIAFLVMRQDFLQFHTSLNGAAQPSFHQADRLFTEAIAYLEKPDFERFDRLVFIRAIINPLYQALQEFHVQMGIETYNRISSQDQAINHLAQTPFSVDFLNPYYFQELPAKVDTQALVSLGQFLFYDPVISQSEKMSCASCHQPNRAFSDGLAKSLDRTGEATVERNAPSLINAVFAGRLFYDLRSDHLGNQIQEVIRNPHEFQTDVWTIKNKLRQSQAYSDLFQQAFPYETAGNQINQYTLEMALGGYVQSLQANNSAFDQYIRGETEQLPTEAKQGFNLFMGKANCGTCHFAPTFSGLVPPLFHESESEILGVPADKEASQLDPDVGRYGNGWFYERAAHYRHSFKTVGIRNVALTAPYMHNGVFETLEEVMDFYNRGGGTGMGLEVPHQTLSSDSLQLTEGEQAAIISFLESLSDTTGTTNYPARLPAFDAGSKWAGRDRSVSY